MVELTKANSQYIIHFWEDLEKRFNEDNIYESFVKLPTVNDNMKLLAQFVNDEMFKYKKDILERQKEKDEIIRLFEIELDVNSEKFVQMSKEEIKSFKKRFFDYSKKLPDNTTNDSLEAAVDLKGLKEKLYEIEIYTKQMIFEIRSNINSKVDEVVGRMNERTNML